MMAAPGRQPAGQFAVSKRLSRSALALTMQGKRLGSGSGAHAEHIGSAPLRCAASQEKSWHLSYGERHEKKPDSTEPPAQTTGRWT